VPPAYIGNGIICPVKERNIIALKAMYDTLPDAKNRVLPQLYQPENYEDVKGIGYENIIWTLYRYGGDSDSVMEWINYFEGAIAVTMPKRRASSGLPARLLEKIFPLMCIPLIPKKT
jgi:hypothetical protein